MYTISSILADIDRHCIINNLNEGSFSYRIAYYINEGNTGRKYYADAAYKDLRKAMERIVRDNLTLENSISISGVTVQKNGKCVYLLSRVYKFNLCDYFQQITGKGRTGNKKRHASYGGYVVNAN